MATRKNGQKPKKSNRQSRSAQGHSVAAPWQPASNRGAKDAGGSYQSVSHKPEKKFWRQ